MVNASRAEEKVSGEVVSLAVKDVASHVAAPGFHCLPFFDSFQLVSLQQK